MQPKWSMSKRVARALTALAVLASCGLTGFADPPAGKSDPPKPLPKDIVQAWQKAGADVGWWRLNDRGFPELAREKQGAAGDMPVLFLSRWESGLLAKLPAPATAFGLYLGDTEVTDAGLKELAALKSLQWLDLFRTKKVTNAGLKELAALKSLQSLNLQETQVTDAGLKELAALKSLQSLNLGGTQVTDAGLKELAALKSLRSLILWRTQVTDVGLKELAALKSLKRLGLEFTKVTDTGLKELRQALPGCVISP